MYYMYLCNCYGMLIYCDRKKTVKWCGLQGYHFLTLLIIDVLCVKMNLHFG